MDNRLPQRTVALRIVVDGKDVIDHVEQFPAGYWHERRNRFVPLPLTIEQFVDAYVKPFVQANVELKPGQRMYGVYRLRNGSTSLYDMVLRPDVQTLDLYTVLRVDYKTKFEPTNDNNVDMFETPPPKQLRDFRPFVFDLNDDKVPLHNLFP